MTEPARIEPSRIEPSRIEPATSPEPRRPMTPPTGGGFPLWGKVLLGCGLVVLVGMLVVGGAAFWAIKRLVEPGKPVEPIAVVRESSVGWVRIESMAEDEGMTELVQRMFLVLQRMGQEDQREQLPEWMRGWYDLSQAQQSNNPAVQWMMPREITLAFDPVEGEVPESDGGEDEGDNEDEEALRFTASLDLGMLARIIGWVGALDKETVNQEEIRGYQAIVNPDSVLVFLDGTLLIAESREEVENLLIRIETAEAGGQLDTDPVYAVLADGAWDAFGRLDNREGDFSATLWEVSEWLGMDPAILSWTTDELTFRLDVVTAQTLEAELTVETVDEEGAEEWVTQLDAYRAQLESEGVPFELSHRAEGSKVFVTLKIDGLDQWLGEKLVAMFDKIERLEEQNWEPEKLPEEDLPAEQPPG